MKKGYVSEGDDWVQGGEMIKSPEKLAKIAAVIERTVLIVEHRHYRGASAPTRLFFEEQEEFLAYLNDHARPGDAFRAWSFDLCTKTNAVATGTVKSTLSRLSSVARVTGIAPARLLAPG